MMKAVGSYVMIENIKENDPYEGFCSGTIFKAKNLPYGTKVIYLKKDVVELNDKDIVRYHILLYYHIIMADVDEDINNKNTLDRFIGKGFK
jgi:hypothetical protein